MVQNTNKSLLENVNEKSDATMVKVFFDEFTNVIYESRYDLKLLDVLEQLHFIDGCILKQNNFQDHHDRYKKLKVALRD